ncbi:hypothetical protein OUZ56_010840 [Daphnia magna]|uniref:Uncharacterized protein n=1 Tax=Daphnia magna TaxID=35525 RepID=A0ABQ9YZ52_9CRUS|nr:hypothetical protein OUZ56_010840 [Daphnia magna]
MRDLDTTTVRTCELSTVESVRLCPSGLRLRKCLDDEHKHFRCQEWRYRYLVAHLGSEDYCQAQHEIQLAMNR